MSEVREATFVMAGPPGGSTPESERVQARMLAALQEAQARGVTDADELRRIIREAIDAGA